MSIQLLCSSSVHAIALVIPWAVVSEFDALCCRAEWKEFKFQYEGEDLSVKWKYFDELNKLQEQKGLALANKLNSNHIQWDMHKMNVKLAAQTLSSSVANAIEFLTVDLNHADFKGSEGTVAFIRSIDMAFDILNSRTPRARGFKSPLSSKNISMCESSLKKTANHLLSAKTLNDKKIIFSRRKTGFLCFAVSIKSIISLAKELIFRPIDPLKYVLTYRLSQDHLEVFFSCVRGRNGWNNNPNSLQFQHSLQKMLFSREVKASLKANCVQYEHEAQTPLFTLKWSKHAAPLNTINVERRNDEESSVLTDIERMSLYSDNVLYYMAGFVCRKMMSSMTCPSCALAITSHIPQHLTEHKYSSSDNCAKLTERKNNGGLVFASNGIFQIVKICEQLFKKFVFSNQAQITSEQGVCKKIIISCVNEVFDKTDKLFPSIKDRQCIASEDPSHVDSHVMQIIKEAAKRYTLIRLQTYAKFFNRVVVNKKIASVRHKMTKCIIFKNQ